MVLFNLAARDLSALYHDHSEATLIPSTYEVRYIYDVEVICEKVRREIVLANIQLPQPTLSGF